MSLKPKVALSQDFLANLSRLSSNIQGKVLKWALRFQSDPTAGGINYERIQGARDPNLRSVRIDQDWRGIVFKPDKGDLYVLMYVDHHDDAYRWAENRRVAIHPVTGAMQVFATETVIEPVLEQARHAGVETASAAEESPEATPRPVRTPLYGKLTDADLLSVGTPAELIPQVRSICAEAELDAMQPFLPVEAYEGLFLVLAGDSISEVLTARETRVDRTIDTGDFAAAIQTAESQARFIVVDDEDTMAAILHSPLAQWRVFLHPSQRKLAQGDKSGPVRVLGGAGTGKTVLAMHRAKWLAEHRAVVGQKIFFTTFTRNLATDIEENLKTLCSPAILERIVVRNLDAWVSAFLRRHKYEYTIVYDRSGGEAAEAWARALAVKDSSLGLASGFYEEEFEHVVLAQGVTSRDEYRQARRVGRGTVLNRAKRDAIWPVYEEFRTQLTSRKLKMVEDAYRDAAILLKDKPHEFSAIVVDETQDFGPQALRLLRSMVPPGPNDLLFVGDGHQRIYNRNRASMSACGIDIRGRSKKLYLNYRTTEEIRRLAVSMLEGCEVDDLDEGSDEVRRYKSISHGPKPEVVKVNRLEDALFRVSSLAGAASQEGRSLCVIVSTGKLVDTVATTLKSAGIPTATIGPNERDKFSADTVRVATMHRAKGLEFDEVVLLNTQSNVFLETSDSRRLLYVAVSRAKQFATAIHF